MSGSFFAAVALKIPASLLKTKFPNPEGVMGSRFPACVYFYRLEADRIVAALAMVVE
ncbi:MAG TPA: hypothetical protein VGM92_04200 [Candidatus Kapabacteria bacterium]